MVGQEYWRVIPFYIIGKQFVCFQDNIEKIIQSYFPHLQSDSNTTRYHESNIIVIMKLKGLFSIYI